MEKQITFTLEGPNGSITGTDPIELLKTVFGCTEGGTQIDPDEKEGLFNGLKEDEFYEYKLIVEKKYTEEDLIKMTESDGDIH